MKKKIENVIEAIRQRVAAVAAVVLEAVYGFIRGAAGRVEAVLGDILPTGPELCLAGAAAGGRGCEWEPRRTRDLCLAAAADGGGGIGSPVSLPGLSPAVTGDMPSDMGIKAELQSIISAHFGIDTQSISKLRPLPGSNHNYSFCVKGDKYVIRKLARPHAVHAEQAAYKALNPLGISDDVLYLDDNGIKISRFLDVGPDGGPVGYDEQDQKQALDMLREKIHESGITIPYQYDIFSKIWEYAALCDDSHADNLKILKGFQDKIDAIKARLDALNIAPVLCHGDACVSTNIMRLKDGSLRFIDWEWTGMADPILDIALAAVHQGVEDDKVDPQKCLEQYLRRKPDDDEIYRLRAYFTLGCFESAAWQINDGDFFDYIRYAVEPYGLL